MGDPRRQTYSRSGRVFLIAAPWFYWVSRATGGQWLSDFITIHHLQRYTAGSGHRQPFHYYLKTLPADFLPWTAFLIPAFFAYHDYRRLWNRAELQICFLWFLTVFIFFTLSDTKRDLYLITLLPTLAFLVANYLTELERQELTANVVYLWVTTSVFAAVFVAGIVLPFAALIVRPDAAGPLIPSCIVLAVGGGVTVALIWRRCVWAMVISVTLMMTLLTSTLSLSFFSYLERFKSHRQFALEINRIVPATASLYVYADITNDFNFYTERTTIPVLKAPAELAGLRARREKSYVLIKERDSNGILKKSRSFRRSGSSPAMHRKNRSGIWWSSLL